LNRILKAATVVSGDKYLCLSSKIKAAGMRETLLVSGLFSGLVASIGNGPAFASSAASSVSIVAAVDLKPSSERHGAPSRLAQMNTNTGVNFNTAAPGVGGYGRHRGPSDPNPRRPPGGAASLEKPEYATGQNSQAAHPESSSETQDTPSFSPSR
jgi:hypothetical protein